MMMDGILIVQGYRNQKCRIRELEEENEWLNEQLGKSEAAAVIKELQECFEGAKAGSHRRDADLEAKQLRMTPLIKEKGLLQAKLEAVGEAAIKMRRSLHHLHFVVIVKLTGP